MTGTERLYRAVLSRAWREYRDTQCLPIAHEYSARAVRDAIQVVRAYANRRGASRPPAWDTPKPQQRPEYPIQQTAA